MPAGNVCIVGAGPSGLALANSLARHDLHVTLVEKNPYPGGRAIRYGCKATDTCVQCGVCLVRDEIETLREQTGVDLVLNSVPVSAERKRDGGLLVTAETSYNPIDWEKCTECGACVESCTKGAIRNIRGWKFYVDESCDSCRACVDSCPVGAISFDRSPIKTCIDADAVVVASGFKPFDTSTNLKWGGGLSARILDGSSLEELLFSQSGLPFDAKKVAFVQCVGSRNTTEGIERCSRVCCPYALRMANRLCYDDQSLAVDIYYMDIQRFGNNFEEFWKSLSDRVNFIRSNPVTVRVDSDGRPVIRFESPETLACGESTYDLVILSHGMSPGVDASRLADVFSLSMDADGFVQQAGNGLRPADGVFTAGSCSTPMRLSECIEDAAAVGARVLSYLQEMV